MNERSGIEWTDATWNPVTGCKQISDGCRNCYALRIAERFRGTPNHPYEQGFDLRMWPERLAQPFRWRKPRMIFVNSMSDLFHPEIPEVFIRQIFETMVQANHHVFQILTKRYGRLQELAPSLPWPDHIWMGVSVETNQWLKRVSALRTTPARIKFVSCEPLLDSLNLDLTDIDWVIVGGESGPRARPMRAVWARNIRDQCQKAQIPFFFKQWGEYDAEGVRRGKKACGRVLDGAVWNEWPAR